MNASRSPRPARRLRSIRSCAALKRRGTVTRGGLIEWSALDSWATASLLSARWYRGLSRGCARRSRERGLRRGLASRAGTLAHDACLCNKLPALPCGKHYPASRTREATSMDVVILVGTMTGNAQLVAQELELGFSDADTRIVVMPMDDLDPGVFERDAVFLVCTSTY